MALYLDSASIDDAAESAQLGFVEGITTNPTLMTQTGRRALDVIPELCDVHPGIVFYQPVAESLDERESDVRLIASLRPGRVGLKLPSTPENFVLARRLALEGHVVAMTAIFSAAQVYLACVAGARFVIPYVNRSTRLLGDGIALVAEMRTVIDRAGADVEIIAASIKSAQEAAGCVLAGSHNVTIPLQLIRDLGHNDLSDQAIEEFAASAKAHEAATG